MQNVYQPFSQVASIGQSRILAKECDGDFSNFFLKSKINRVIELWQKYNVIENDLIDKLNRISNTSKIDIALSEKSANNSDDKTNTLSNELDRSADKQGGTAKKLKPSASPNKITKTEISKVQQLFTCGIFFSFIHFFLDPGI